MRTHKKLSLWVVMLMLFTGLGLVGCNDSTDDIFQGNNNGNGNAAAASAPVTLSFNPVTKRLKIVPVPATTTQVTLSGTDANDAAVQTANPTFPVTLDYTNPLGPVNIPTAVRHLHVDFKNAQGTILGTGDVNIELTQNQAQTVNVPFNDGQPNPTGDLARLYGNYYLELLGPGSMENREIRGALFFDGAGHVSGTLRTFASGDNTEVTATVNAASQNTNYSISPDGILALNIVTDRGTITAVDGQVSPDGSTAAFAAGVVDIGGGEQASYNLVRIASGTNNASLNGTFEIGGNLAGNITFNQVPTAVRGSFFGTIVMDGSGHVTGGHVKTYGLGAPEGNVTGGSYVVNSDGTFNLTYTTNVGTFIVFGAVGTDGQLIFSLNPGAGLVLSGQCFPPSNTLVAGDYSGNYYVNGLLMQPATAGYVHGLLNFNGTTGVPGGSLTFIDDVTRAVMQGGTYGVAANALTFDVTLTGGQTVSEQDGLTSNTAKTLSAGVIGSSLNGIGYVNLIRIATPAI